MEKLAIYGGEKVKTTPFGTGKRFGKEELKHLEEALNQNTLFYWYGKKVKELNAKFADMYGMKHCVATSSGTAALHTALGACGVTAGDEVITSPITDMGTIIGIIYQQAVPIFADVDPHTYNITAESIEKCITDRTKAILVVHLAGTAADMDPIMEVARKHNIKVIEDCAQAYMTYYKGRLAGTIGDIGCFSLNDFKHISAGDGGMCITNDDELFERAWKFTDKNYSRVGTGVGKSIEFIAPNYRMSELVGAVGIAQLDRVEEICRKRNIAGEKITAGIKDLKGIYPPVVAEGDKSSYWFYLFRVNEEELGTDTDTFIEAVNAEGVFCKKGYIASCVYEYDMFKTKTGLENSHAPFVSSYYDKEVNYDKGLCPVAEEVLSTSVQIIISEFYTDEDVEAQIKAIRKVATYFNNKK